MDEASPAPRHEGAADDLAGSFSGFRFVLCASTLLMLGLSWPLWVGTGDFPRVPFVPALPSVPVLASRVLFGLLLACLAAAAAGLAWRAMLGLGVVLLVVSILQDQHRFQPWVYQFILTGLALAAASKARGLGLARLFIVALYLHSGLSKLDVSFSRELGDAFLRTAVGPLGLDPSRWPSSARTAAVLAMPAWEVVVAAGLCFRATRRVVLIGAVAQHAALLGILGPWGLRHSTIVLVWNAALLVEDVLLFGSVTPGVAGDPEEEPAGAVGLTRWAFLLAVLMPFGERWGIWDTWPSFALYASHAERTEVLVHEDDLSQLPEAIRRHASAAGQGPWRRLDLTGWSRAARGVPVYPQGRACNGLAEGLADRYPGLRGLGVVQWGRADRWTGRRARVECWGAEAIRRQGDRYRLNAHPATAPRRPAAWRILGVDRPRLASARVPG